MSKTVGVVVWGAMGSAMAIMLVKAGFRSSAFDRANQRSTSSRTTGQTRQ